MNKKILILDDQNYIKVVVESLEYMDYEVKHVFDIKSALEIYQDFDLIICDVDLDTEEDGFDFYDKIKELYTGKFFFHSGCDKREEAEERGVPFYFKSEADYEKIVQEMLS